MFKTAMITVLALCGLSVSASAQFGIRLDRQGVQVCVGPTCEVPRTVEYGRSPRLRASRGVARRSFGSRHVRGYWKTVRERVWVPGFYERVHVPAQYGWRIDSCGRRVRYCVRPARYENVWRPGCWEWQSRRVWVPGRRVCR